jgi:hypothetical protein
MKYKFEKKNVSFVGLCYVFVPECTVQENIKWFNTVLSESRCTLGIRYVDLVVSIKVAVEVSRCCVPFHCIQLLNGG